MLDATDWEFPTEEQPAFLEDGTRLPNTKVIVRTDTNTILGEHSKRYQMNPYSNTVDTLMDAVHSANLTSDYDLKIHVLEEGRKMKGTITFPDLVVEPAVGDYIHFRIQFYDSYDGSWAISQAADALRLWCLNGCTTPDSIASTWAKHTSNINLQGSAAKILAGYDIFANSKEE